MEKLCTLSEKLKKRGFNSHVAASIDEARSIALSLIDKEDTVGFGGSMTISESGLYDALVEKGNTLYWHWKCTPEERVSMMYAGSSADIYVSSSNAILEDGTLINIDGNGNRVNAYTFGPKKRVILMIGRNKLCGDHHDGIKRIKSIACPKNGQRLKLQTPCAITGKCTDCNSPQRMCNVTSVLKHPGFVKDFHIILVDVDMGY